MYVDTKYSLAKQSLLLESLVHCAKSNKIISIILCHARFKHSDKLVEFFQPIKLPEIILTKILIELGPAANLINALRLYLNYNSRVKLYSIMRSALASVIIYDCKPVIVNRWNGSIVVDKTV